MFLQQKGLETLKRKKPGNLEEQSDHGDRLIDCCCSTTISDFTGLPLVVVMGNGNCRSQGKEGFGDIVLCGAGGGGGLP